MAIRIQKVADIIEGKVIFVGPYARPAASSSRMKERSDILSALRGLEVPPDPDPSSAWTVVLSFTILSDLFVELPPRLSVLSPEDVPVCFLPASKPHRLLYFRDRLFIAERAGITAAERDEIVLRVKKAVYDEDAELSSLRAAVANLDAAIRFERSGPKRDPIPEDVKMLVWARDGGSCIRCGSKKDLHFDHIIPVAKGGGNSEENIQLLCQPCNLRKADKISFV